MYIIFSFLFFISLLCIPIFIVLSLISSVLKRPNKKYIKNAKKSALVFVASMFGLMLTYKAPPIESINLSIPEQQVEYDINTEIPIEVTIYPENADTKSLEYLTDEKSLSFSDAGITTGSDEGTYNVYIRSGNITSNKISITVADIAARKAEEKRLAEEKAAKEEEEKRLAEEKAAKEAEEQAAKEAEEKRLATEQAAKEAAAQTPPSSGNGNNFDTYDNAEQQQTSDTFVLNTSRHKIHRPSCRDVKKISPENYSTSSLTLDELKAQGYTTCGHCF